MNWTLLAQTVLSVATIVFIAGKTYGRIADQEKALERHEKEMRGQDERLERHDEVLEDHGTRIDTLETESEKTKAWHEGFTAGAAKHKGQI